MLPDNVLFQGGASETIRRALLKQADGDTLLRLPTDIFFAQGVKANPESFRGKPAAEKPWTEKLWIYDLRTNLDFTPKENTLKRSDLDDFVNCYFGCTHVSAKRDTHGSQSRGYSGSRHTFDRLSAGSLRKENDHFRSFTYEDLLKRDKFNLDIFCLKDESLEDSAS